MSGMLAASTKTTEWEMNYGGNNGKGINDGSGKDPDADDAREFGDFFDDEY